MTPLLEFDSFAQTAHILLHEKHFITRLLIYYNRVQLRNSQNGRDAEGISVEEEVPSFRVLGAHKLEALQRPSFCNQGFITQARLIKPLASGVD